jgi:adenosylhomocysteine nucleosidase
LNPKTRLQAGIAFGSADYTELDSIMLRKVSWSWPAFPTASPAESGWHHAWTGAWTGAWAGAGDESLTEAGEGAAGLGLSGLSERSVVALVGLAFEARIAAGPGVLVICRGGSRETAELVRIALRAGCRSIISFGVAGGLAPDLVPGDCVVASAIIDHPTLQPTDPLWSRKLTEMIPDARYGPIVGVNAVISNPADKRRLRALTGAVAVDMESHLVARLAASHCLAFTAVRVVIDPADRAVPHAALLAMAPGGSTDFSSMLWDILARPSQLSLLVRLAADAYAARTALVRLRRALGPGFSSG